jgi:hypothetical protein
MQTLRSESLPSVASPRHCGGEFSDGKVTLASLISAASLCPNKQFLNRLLERGGRRISRPFTCPSLSLSTLGPFPCACRRAHARVIARTKKTNYRHSSESEKTGGALNGSEDGNKLIILKTSANSNRWWPDSFRTVMPAVLMRNWSMKWIVTH